MAADTIVTNELIQSIASAGVDDTLLDDALSLYAKECLDDGDRDSFVDDFLEDDERVAELRKAVADVLAISLIMDTSKTIDDFQTMLNSYNDEFPVSEEDDDVRKMKTLMLRKLAEDTIAINDSPTSHTDLYPSMLELIEELFENYL